MNEPDLKKIFNEEYSRKSKCFVTINQACVNDSSYAFHINLGSCASVVLCGKTAENKILIGANHLFKSRDKNDDMALIQIAGLHNSLIEQNAVQVACLGLFGAGYREKSIAGQVAQKNIMGILEALSFYNLSIELFQTGYSQDVTLLKSDRRNSFLINHYNMHTKEKKIIEIPLDKLFSNQNEN